MEIKDKQVHLIPQIKFTTLDYGYEISRIQFPVRLCFAMISVMVDDSFIESLRIHVFASSFINTFVMHCMCKICGKMNITFHLI